jgi:hypothetical protein
MIGRATNGYRWRACVPKNTAQICVCPREQVSLTEEWITVLGRKNEMNEQTRERLWHIQHNITLCYNNVHPRDPLALTALDALGDRFLGLAAQAKISSALRASPSPLRRVAVSQRTAIPASRITRSKAKISSALRASPLPLRRVAVSQRTAIPASRITHSKIE